MGFRALYRKEMQAYFGAPLFYVVAAVFLGLSGFFFYTNLIFFVHRSRSSTPSCRARTLAGSGWRAPAPRPSRLGDLVGRVDAGRDPLVRRAERQVVEVLDAGERVVRLSANCRMPASRTLRGIAVQ